jgi:hypothetical protein
MKRKEKSKMKIELACDHHRVEEFAAWLRDYGHDVTIGCSIANYVDGVRTSSDDRANESLNQLWHEYLNQSSVLIKNEVQRERESSDIMKYYLPTRHNI